MRIRWEDSTGIWLGRHVEKGDVVDVEDRKALAYVRGGQASFVPDEIRTADPVVINRDPRPRRK
jgi:hypothetical protein